LIFKIILLLSFLLLSQLIIRSHEGPDAREKRPGFGGMEEGYTIDHVVESGKLITLFSAPDYPQFQVL
jgi:serine/threonine-protein phosphatase 5